MTLSAKILAAALTASVFGLGPVLADSHTGTTVHIGIHPAQKPVAMRASRTPAASHRAIVAHGAGVSVVAKTGRHPRWIARVAHRSHRPWTHFVGHHGHWRYAGGDHRWRHAHRGYKLYSDYNDYAYGDYGNGSADYADTYAGGPPADYGNYAYDNDAGYGAPVIADDPGSGGRYSVWGGYNSDNGVNNFF